MNMLLIAAILATLAPGAPNRNVYAYARAIELVSSNEHEATALIVTAVRESRLSLRCVSGIGGLGGFQLNPAHFPREVACGPLQIQAAEALRLLKRKGFAGYLGASNKEAKHRKFLQERALSMSRCQCSW